MQLNDVALQPARKEGEKDIMFTHQSKWSCLTTLDYPYNPTITTTMQDNHPSSSNGHGIPESKYYYTIFSKIVKPILKTKKLVVALTIAILVLFLECIKWTQVVLTKNNYHGLLIHIVSFHLFCR